MNGEIPPLTLTYIAPVLLQPASNVESTIAIGVEELFIVNASVAAQPTPSVTVTE